MRGVLRGFGPWLKALPPIVSCCLQDETHIMDDYISEI